MNTLEVLQSVTRLFPRVFVIVDTLEECSDGTRAEFLPALQSLGNIVNLLVTSRDIPAIARDFQDNKPLDIRANSADVRRYIEGRIPQLSHLRIHVDNDVELKEEIVKAIIRSVDGMLVSTVIIFTLSLMFCAKVFTSAISHGHVGNYNHRSGSS